MAMIAMTTSSSIKVNPSAGGGCTAGLDRNPDPGLALRSCNVTLRRVISELRLRVSLVEAELPGNSGRVAIGKTDIAAFVVAAGNDVVRRGPPAVVDNRG